MFLIFIAKVNKLTTNLSIFILPYWGDIITVCIQTDLQHPAQQLEASYMNFKIIILLFILYKHYF